MQCAAAFEMFSSVHLFISDDLYLGQFCSKLYESHQKLVIDSSKKIDKKIRASFEQKTYLEYICPREKKGKNERNCRGDYDERDERAQGLSNVAK